ncbi:ABC transporter ATP-binding protein [Parasporobacterium paucivorans]|uniref:ATP-binding cassette, subfamily B n=1 Tax=Parasporobacterium paucivorans DSM 15970 TaxID=1122934 RepID=A0A1M6GN66_9FIRM|nr:ABC transporter ATP-binding protein [Parasporobacterium paucivorans]SHJ11359.1 ATP-binding cassette, subfamily B [Parasporobacterium paucivorans DSM 15970]
MGKSEDNQSSRVRIPGHRSHKGFQDVEKPREGKKTFGRLFGYFGEEKWMVFGLLSAVVLTVVCSVYAPSLQSHAIDRIAEGSFGRVPPILAIMLGVYLILGICTLFQNLISNRLSQRIVRRIREELFDKIVNLPIRYLDTHSHGDIMSRMTNDVENISSTVSQSLTSFISGIFTVIGTVIMMVWFSWELALLSCTTVILTVLATKYLSKAMRKSYRKRQALLGQLNGSVEEMVIGFKTVTAYNRQRKAMEGFDATSDELTRVSILSDFLSGAMGPVINSINNIGFVIIAAFGGYFAINGYISIGVISAFIVYAKQFGRPVNEIAQVYGQVQTAIAGAERVFAILDEMEEDKGGEKNMDSSKGVITFKNVNFSYNPEKRVLHNFNLEIFAGHKVALVGATGSGKTTVVNLLMRFYDTDSGGILIDGVDIRDIDCNELRRNTAIVMQDTVLFSDTIRNNLKYARPDATDEQMEEAAKMSNCHNLIKRLPDGYNTLLTEAGDNLSQGQRQLLSIARAVLADPRILVLDEATSSVDTRTEKHIQDAMVNLMKDRTSLIIAHRLSTIRDADLIVVLDQGRIAETGNHMELLNKKGPYHDLYMTQFAGNQI